MNGAVLMVRKRKPVARNSRVLTEAELGVMRALWSLGTGNVHDVQAAIEGGESFAYTTVSTILRILEEKDFVRAKEAGRSHIYSPIVQRSEYEQRAVQHLVKRLFNDSPLGVVKHLISSDRVTREELAEIRKMIDQLQSQAK